MFEKEAEKWTIDYVCKDCSRYKECRSKEQCTCKECSKEKWQKGAEFGYNKANEWHKADIPTSQINKVVLGYIKDYNSKMFCLVKWNGEWWYDARTYNDRVKLLAWKEIVLPKESEMTDDLPKFEE